MSTIPEEVLHKLICSSCLNSNPSLLTLCLTVTPGSRGTVANVYGTAAAKADDRIDRDARQRIGELVAVPGLDRDTRIFVPDEQAGPLDSDTIMAPVECEEIAAGVYAASLMAMGHTRAAVLAYLTLLTSRLNLVPCLVRHLNANIEGGSPATHLIRNTGFL